MPTPRGPGRVAASRGTKRALAHDASTQNPRPAKRFTLKTIFDSSDEERSSPRSARSLRVRKPRTQKKTTSYREDDDEDEDEEEDDDDEDLDGDDGDDYNEPEAEDDDADYAINALPQIGATPRPGVIHPSEVTPLSDDSPKSGRRRSTVSRDEKGGNKAKAATAPEPEGGNSSPREIDDGLRSAGLPEIVLPVGGVPAIEQPEAEQQQDTAQPDIGQDEIGKIGDEQAHTLEPPVGFLDNELESCGASDICESMSSGLQLGSVTSSEDAQAEHHMPHASDEDIGMGNTDENPQIENMDEGHERRDESVNGDQRKDSLMRVDKVDNEVSHDKVFSIAAAAQNLPPESNANVTSLGDRIQFCVSQLSSLDDSILKHAAHEEKLAQQYQKRAAAFSAIAASTRQQQLQFKQQSSQDTSEQDRIAQDMEQAMRALHDQEAALQEKTAAEIKQSCTDREAMERQAAMLVDEMQGLCTSLQGMVDHMAKSLQESDRKRGRTAQETENVLGHVWKATMKVWRR